MSMKYVDITTEIRITHVFKCSECKKEQLGNARSYHFNGNNTYDMDVIISNSKPEPNYMPKGWFCYLKGRTKMFCCGCKQKYDEK